MALKELLKRGIGKLLKNKKTDPVNRLKPVEYGMVSESPKLKHLMNSVESDPTLYFNAFAIEVTPAMKYTQKLYKKEGGLVVDMFKTL